MLRTKKKKKKKKKTFLGPYLNTVGEMVSNCITFMAIFQGTEEIFSGSPVLFSGSKGVLISYGGLCESSKHLHCNCSMTHDGI